VSDPLVIRIHPNDDVVIARRQLVGGTRIESEGITVAGLIPPGHKVATRPIAAGAPVRRYDQIIGSARQAIAPGQHVHTPQPRVLELCARLRRGERARGDREYVATPATFDGIVRADGRIATRPHRHPDLGQLLRRRSRAIADRLARRNPRALERFPNVDGVARSRTAPAARPTAPASRYRSCAARSGGYARHANFASVLVVGLGCETNQISGLMESRRTSAERTRPPPHRSHRRPAAPGRPSRGASS
jgi:altronate hydrolase